MKLVRGSEEFVSCPNKKCINIAFVRPETYCCSEDVECEACGMHWRLPGQTKRHSGSYIVKALKASYEWIMDKLYNNNTYSDLYKVLFA